MIFLGGVWEVNTLISKCSSLEMYGRLILLIKVFFLGGVWEANFNIKVIFLGGVWVGNTFVSKRSSLEEYERLILKYQSDLPWRCMTG